MTWYTMTHQAFIAALSRPQQSFRILDIRPREQFEAGHVRGSEHHDCVALRRFAQHANRDEPVVLICRRGRTSRHAAMWLDQLGFKAVYSLSEGYDAICSQLPSGIDTANSEA